MAKAKIPNQKKAYERLNKRLSKYVGRVRAIYDELNLEASKIAARTGYDSSSGKEFRFSDYPNVTAQVKDLQDRFVNDIKFTIVSGISTEWRNSNEMQDLLADKVLKAYNVKRGDARTKRYYQVNNDALKSFQQRKDKGMNLSQKIWNQSDDYKQGLESAISTAIEKGMSAVILSKKVSKYLKDFDSLKKDYKKRFGTATNAKDCEYRSIRLARSEINMAYRNAEQLRWQQMDFILGYEIKLSHSHPCHDICDELAGRYPKDFKWTGWHPNDLCYVIPIIKSEELFWMSDKERGDENSEITDVPKGFKDWVANNQDRIAKAEQRGTLPYFVRDNKSYMNVMSVKEIAKERHAKRDENAIRRAWENRKLINSSPYYDLLKSVRKDAKLAKIDISDLEYYISTAEFKVDEYGSFSHNERAKLMSLLMSNKSLIDVYKKSLYKYSDYPEFLDEALEIIRGTSIYADYTNEETRMVIDYLKTKLDDSFQIYASRNYTEKFTINSQESYFRIKDKLGQVTKKVWNDFPLEYKNALVEYTGGESGHILYNLGNDIPDARADGISAILDKISTQEDIVLRSGQNPEMLDIIWGKGMREKLINGDIDGLNSEFANKIGVNKAFMSTSYNEYGGFKRDVEFHIFAPKGTHLMNVEEISEFGRMVKVTDWDGYDFSKNWAKYGGESEFLLHKGYRFKFIRAERGTGLGGSTRIYVQLLDRD